MFLSLRELKHGKWRFAMIGSILILISWLVFILSGLGNGLSYHSASKFIDMDADYVVFEEGARHSMYRSVFSENLVDELLAQENVLNAAPMGISSAVILNEGTDLGDEKIDIAMMGIKPGSFLEDKVIEGSPLQVGQDNQVLVDAALKADGVKLGDILDMEGITEKLEVIGFVENQSYNHLPGILMSMDQWRAIHFAAPGSDMGIEAPINAIMLQGEEIIAEDIDRSISGIETVTKEDAINGIPGNVEKDATIMMMLGFLLAISAIVIAVFFYVLTLQKTNQFGIMKAIGASNGFLAKAIVSQVFILSFISIGIGVLITYGTAAMLPEAMPFKLDMGMVLSYALILLIISVLSSLASVRRITKIDPLLAIGRVE